MKKWFYSLIVGLCAVVQTASAEENHTKQIDQFSTDKVKVWQTVIYPGDSEQLKLHRHDNDRVVVALSNGVLKITTEAGDYHFFELIEGKAYYLKSDKPGELHYDKNISQHPIKMMVVELLGVSSNNDKKFKAKKKALEINTQSLPTTIE